MNFEQAGGHGGRERSIRISREVSSLATSLPVQPESSIFLRVDEDRFDVMRAMITGPKDTPYEVCFASRCAPHSRFLYIISGIYV